MDDEYRRLPGEQTSAELALPAEGVVDPRPSVLLLSPIDTAPVPVAFLITNYRVHATPAATTGVAVSCINLPLMMIEHHYTGQEGTNFTLTLQTKLVFAFTFGFTDESVFRRIVRHVGAVLQPTALKYLPAFSIAKAVRRTAAATAAPLASAKSVSVTSPDTVAPMTDGPLSPPPPPLAGGDDATGGDASPLAPSGTETRLAPAAADPPTSPGGASSEYTQGSNATAAVAAGECPAEWIADAGWALYDPVWELQRELVPDWRAPPEPAGEDGLDAAGVKKDLRPWFRATALGQPSNTYGTFATYPLFLVAPNSCSDDLLLRAAVFRSRARIPAISFVCLATGGVLARSSQPMLRQSDAARRDDSQLCNAFLNPYSAVTTKPRDNAVPIAPTPAPAASAANPSAFVAPPSLVDDNEWVMPTEKEVAVLPTTGAKYLHVIDLRPKAAATGNLAMGGGFETGVGYSMCRVSFAGIDNIHGVSSSWSKLRGLVTQYNGRAPKPDFPENLAGSQWLHHIQRVLSAADNIAQLLAKGEHVLTHCTDGWDRTSQATSIAMMLLDPFFRTVRGFCILIEKEFCAFGHKFAERNNHDAPGDTCGTAHISAGLSDVDRTQDQAHGTHKRQPSPIFSQWLDCVFQVVRQFPTKFEFTPNLLELIAFHLHSCYFGTFLCNCAKERVLEGVTTRTLSLWSEIERLCHLERAGPGAASLSTSQPSHPPYPAATRRLLNPLYAPPPAGFNQASIDHLKLSTSSARLVFWESFYLRFNGERWHLGPAFEEAALAHLPPLTAEVDEPVYEAATARRPALQQAHEAAVDTRDPAITRRREVQQAAAGVPPNHVAPDPKAKQCWRCHERFGLFKAGQPCAGCQHLHCSKCLHTPPPRGPRGAVPGGKQCESCIAIMAE